MFLTASIPVSANKENYTIMNDFKVKYKHIIYDLSTKEGNLKLVENNQNMSVAEYIKIINFVVNDEALEIQFNSIDTSKNIDPLAIVPDDPLPGGPFKYHGKMYWFFRDQDGWNLGVTPTNEVKSSFINANKGWDEVVKYQSSNSHWYNEASLKGQYLCHFWFAQNKAQWNIAPSIPNKNAFEWVVDRCN